MFVSYIVATYNCADRVEFFNRTVRELSGVDCEFCISDGGSSDKTLASIIDAPNVRVLRSAPDDGIYDAWNQVLSDCRGEYLAFIGIDDQPTAEFVEAANQFCGNSANQPLLIYGDRILQRGRHRRTIVYSATPQLFEAERPVFDIPHQAALNHRSLFQAKRFDSHFQLAGDLDFYIAQRNVIREQGYCYLPLPQVVASEEGVSRSAKSFNVYMKEYAAIERAHGLALGYSGKKLSLLSRLERFPGIYEMLKQVSWWLRHDRA